MATNDRDEALVAPVVDAPTFSTPTLKHGRKPSKEKEGVIIRIPEVQVGIVKIGIVGARHPEPGMIVNKFSEKARRIMREKQMGIAVNKKEPKVPFDDFCGALHVMPGAKLPLKKLDIGESWPFKANTFGVPAISFKHAALSAARFCDNVKSGMLKAAIHVVGDLVPLEYDRVIMREDVVRIGKWPNITTDLRYRGEFVNWRTTLTVRYMKIVTLDQVVNLFQMAGLMGVGEWRPSSPDSSGPFGTFSVQPATA